MSNKWDFTRSRPCSWESWWNASAVSLRCSCWNVFGPLPSFSKSVLLRDGHAFLEIIHLCSADEVSERVSSPLSLSVSSLEWRSRFCSSLLMYTLLIGLWCTISVRVYVCVGGINPQGPLCVLCVEREGGLVQLVTASESTIKGTYTTWWL